jgi:elongation factor P
MTRSITDLKKGTLVQIDGQPWRVVEYSQKVMGRGGSIVNVKLKNLIGGNVLERTFKGSEKVDPAEVSAQAVQFLYRDGADFHFMNSRTYDQFVLRADVVGDAARFLKDGMEVSALHFTGRVIAVELPVKVSLTVVEAEPGIKGDTVSAVTKTARLETGASVQVPVFVNAGDRVVVDTRDGSYIERTK